jgi:hypothetical protein
MANPFTLLVIPPENSFSFSVDPVSKILSTEYMKRHRLSAGGIQCARNKLEKLDLIEKHNNIWKIVDPVFGCWLAGY